MPNPRDASFNANPRLRGNPSARPLPTRPAGSRESKSADSPPSPEPRLKGLGVAGWRPYIVPIAAGAAALLLAWLAESIVRSGDTTTLSLLIYLAAIGLFALTAPATGGPARSRTEKPLVANDADPGPAASPKKVEQASAPTVPSAGSRRPLAIIGSAAAGSIAAATVAMLLLRADLSSVPAVWLWLLSMVVLLAGGIVASRWQVLPALWGRNVWPKDRRTVWVAIGALALIIVVASAARLIGLDRVPFGINADEGDRAATAIQIIRGQNTQSLFDNGWYWISILYFWLLAQVMKIAGISFVGARVFGALAGIISVGLVTWIGARNFGLRTGLLAGGLLSMMAVALQFARETSEAGPTATLWAASVACFLEAARRGRYWAWVGAGLSGGLSIYLYPTGRLWAVLAALVCGYLLVHGLGGRRRQILLGSALSALASILAVAPFLFRAFFLGRMEMITQRAQETSIFTGDNISRLNYVEPGWNIIQLLVAQVARSVGSLNQFHGGTDFWPVDTPVMPIGLSILTLLGLGWCCLKLRDPRFAVLAIWFWVGLLGVIITVETPNLQRMATAIPVLALFAALALNSLAQRIERLVDGMREAWPRLGPALRGKRVGATVAGLFVAVVVGVVAAGQYQTYFVEYGSTDRWPQPSYLGWAVRDAGTDGVVFTLGQQYHMINSGWVRLLAPDARRGGIISPGSDLPVRLPADQAMTFLLFPKQATYIPYLRSLYPGGTVEQHNHPTEGLLFTTYKIPREAWSAQEGALVHPPSGEPQRVSNLGVLPPDWTSFPAQMRWTAELSAPKYGNYAFRLGPGPARLEIDGREVVKVDAGRDGGEAVVSLARGSHYVVFDGTLESPADTAPVLWASAADGSNTATGATQWQEIATAQLSPAQDGPRGLYALAQAAGNPEQRRIDGTLASCRPVGVDPRDGGSTKITWTGTLDAPASGAYSMTLSTQGPVVLKIDGEAVITLDKRQDAPGGATVDLSKGKHPVEIDYTFDSGQGCIEWVWTPPGGETSIVPPSVLAPPQGAGIGDPVPRDVLGEKNQQPSYNPIEVVP